MPACETHAQKSENFDSRIHRVLRDNIVKLRKAETFEPLTQTKHIDVL